MTDSVSSATPDPEDLAPRPQDEEAGEGDEAGSGPSPLDLDVGPEVVDGEIAEYLPDDNRRVVTTSASFSGPLPPPDVLRGYDDVVPGLAREIVDQWKSETAHRHMTITSMRETDHQAMEAFYAAERLGQIFALVCFIGVLIVAGIAIAYDRPVVGVASLVVAGGGLVWAMRRRSDGPSDGPPTDIGDGDAVESVESPE